MPVLIRYAPPGLTQAQYNQVSDTIEAAGRWPPDGLIAHVCFGPDGDMRVSEIWESPEQLEAFQQQLMPALREAGIDTDGTPPEMQEVYGIESIQRTYSGRS